MEDGCELAHVGDHLECFLGRAGLEVPALDEHEATRIHPDNIPIPVFGDLCERGFVYIRLLQASGS